MAHPVLMFQWSQLGWIQDHTLSLHLLAPKVNNLSPWFKWEMGKFWHLAHEPWVNVWPSNEMLHLPGVSKFIDMLPDLIPTTDSELTMLKLNLEWKSSPHHVGNTEVSGDSLPNPKAVCLTYWLNGSKKAFWVVWSATYSKQWSKQLLAVPQTLATK